MKLIILLILGITIMSCTSTPDKQERISREPVKYWNFIEEENNFVEEKLEKESGKVYYWGYDGE